MLDPDCFKYLPNFLPSFEADNLCTFLYKELEWRQDEIVLFGRHVMQPRLIAWYGDPEATYSYSGLQLKPLPWHSLLTELKLRIEALTGAVFNSVLANAYRHGSDSMGWHRDDEKELGPRPVIASLSLGQERRFLVREKGQKSQGLLLGNGSLLIMKGQCQQKYQHALPKTRRKAGVRINLTYRMIRDQQVSDLPLRTAG